MSVNKAQHYTGRNNSNFIGIILAVQCKYRGSGREREEMYPFKLLYVITLQSKFEFMDMTRILNFDI